MPIVQPFLGSTGPTSVSDRWYTVTPDDAADLPEKPRGIMARTGGAIVMAGADGVSATFEIAAGQQLLAAPHRILATGTTATGIVAMI